MIETQAISMSTLLATHYGLTILSMPNVNQQPFFTWQSGGICCCRAAQYAAAKAKYRECLQHTPKETSVLNNLSAAHLKLQKWKPALVCAQAVLRSELRHFTCLCCAGAAHMHVENYHGAIASLQTAVEMVGSAVLHCQCAAHSQMLQHLMHLGCLHCLALTYAPND